MIRYAARIAAVAGVYFGAAKFGLTLGYENSSITAVWPPTGIALAALVLGGYRLWPGVALGALLANLWTGVPLLAVVGITAGNTMEAVAGTFLLRRVAHFNSALERVRDVAALAVLAGGLSTMVSATVGVATLSLAGQVTGGELASAWRVWWLGDMGGDLLVAPLLLLLAHGLRLDLRPARIAEGALALTALVGVGVFAFSHHTQLAYLVFPLLMWMALRFGQRGAALAGAIVAGIAVYFTNHGRGPFVSGSPDDNLLLSQSFMSFAAITALLLAAVTLERERARRLLRIAHDHLDVEVRERTADLRSANDALTKTEVQLSEAQRLAHIGSWEWDIAANELTWSDEMYRIYGLDPERFGASYEAFLAQVHPDDRETAETVVGAALADPGRFDFHHRIVRTDGAVRILHARGDVVVGDDGTPVQMFGTGQDVTERERDKREADRLKDEFFALVSHELKTPLSSIKGYVELLLEGSGGAEANAKAREFLATIERNTGRLERLVGDLLFAAQVQSGEFGLNPEIVDLGKLVAQCVAAAESQAAERTTELALDREPGCRCAGDPDRLAQLFDNLISNALQYTPYGGRVEVTVASRGDTAVVRIRDTGIGMTPADRERVYERFFRARGATEQSVPGVGLGLPIARAIAEAHNGRIDIESRKGLGSTVRVELPLEAAAPTALPKSHSGVAV
jgi:signal transduction histidine kinase/integral membrane sensor domain MASE1